MMPVLATSSGSQSRKFFKKVLSGKRNVLLLQSKIGVWRSWLAHLHGVQGVGSSSLLTPTYKKRYLLNING